MKKLCTLFTFVLFFVLGMIALSFSASAYIDPSATTYLIGTITAVVIAGGAATVGCACQMVGFAVMSFKENGVGGLISEPESGFVHAMNAKLSATDRIKIDFFITTYPFVSNLYPTPQTVFRVHFSEMPSSLSRRRLICTSTVRESPK